MAYLQMNGPGGFDWDHALSALAGSVLGALAVIGKSLFRAGAKEPGLRLDFQTSLSNSERLVEEKIDTAMRGSQDKLDNLVDQFHDSFAALRQKINDVELGAARNFVAKADFEEFRAEYRQDKNRMFEKLDNLLSRK